MYVPHDNDPKRPHQDDDVGSHPPPVQKRRRQPDTPPDDSPTRINVHALERDRPLGRTAHHKMESDQPYYYPRHDRCKWPTVAGRDVSDGMDEP